MMPFPFQLGGVGSDFVDNDIYFNNVSLLLHFDGANSSTTFTDSSENSKTLTANGNAQISTAQSKFGGASGLFDGSGDEVSFANSSDFAFSGDFTIEAFVYIVVSDTTDRNIYITANNGGLSFGLNGKKLQVGANNVAYDVKTSADIATSQWVHVAASRSGTTLRLFVNGTQDGSATITRTYTSSGSHYIGSGGSLNYFNGYIDELRITKGVARYTANFTPPAYPYSNV